MTQPCVLSVNVGPVREIEWRGKLLRTGIWKESVGDESVAVRGVNLDGDDQADRTVHGGVDKAVYAYATEDYAYWSEHEQIDVAAGLFGENITTRGMNLSDALVGERWRVGSALLEVAQPRLPCFKLGIRMGDAKFPKHFQHVGRLGAYLRIIEEGSVRATDTIEVTSRPAHRITLRYMLETLADRSKAPGLLEAGRLPSFWHRIALGSEES